MNDTIRLMQSHFSVRRFKEEPMKEADLKEILSAGQMASSWKNFQSYSVVVVKSSEKKEAIRQSSVFLLFVGDLNRAEKAVKLHEKDFHPEGVDNLLITSVDAALAAQNTLLAAESLGYGGVIIGMLRYCAEEVAELFRLPDYTYPVFGIALGVPNQQHAVKPRLPLEHIAFEEEYQVQDLSVVTDYDKVQADYAGVRATDSWSERLAAQFGQPEEEAIKQLLEKHKLL